VVVRLPARVLLAEALHIAKECGAGWYANRARIEWRRAGGRTRTHKPDELSPQEAAVAQLAQAGRTNRPNSSTCPSRQWKPTSGISFKNSVSAADGSSPRP
jgi:hypothetical protein